MANKQLVIPLSFKQSEIDLYNIIKERSGYSNWIKDIIKEHLKNSENNNMYSIPVFKEWE